MKKTLIFFLLFTLLALPTRADASFRINNKIDTELQNGLVGHYTFDVNKVNLSTRVVTDSSVMNNTGTTQGSMTASTARVPGRLSHALKLDGVDDYIILNSNFTDTSAAYTATVWINYDSNSRMMLLAKGDHGSSPFYAIEISHLDGGTNTFGIRSFTGAGNGIESVYASGLSQNRWHHIAIRRNTATKDDLTFFLNGNRVATSSASQASAVGPNPTTSVFIGGRNVGGSLNSPFSGAIDDMRIYSRALTDTEVQKIYRILAPIKTSTSGSPGSLASGLVGHWTFDGSKIWQNVSDSSGNGNHGVFTGISATSSALLSGKIGQALRFDGSDDNVVIPDHASLDVTTTYSFSLWFKPDNLTQTNRYLLGKLVNASNDNVYAVAWEYTNNTVVFYCFSNCNGIGSPSSNTNIAVNDTQWHHITYTYDGSTFRGYLDGSVAITPVSGSFPLTASTGQLVLADFINGAGQNFQGALDDVRIYNRALSAGEVKALYAQGVPNKQNASTSAGPLASGLAGHWTMDGNRLNWATGVVTDASGSGNNGALRGMMSTTTAPTEGKVGQGLIFDGSDDHINITSAVVDSVPLTMCAWFKSNSATASQTIVSIGQAANDDNYFRLVAAGNISGDPVAAAISDSPGEVRADSSTGYTVGKWHHACGVYTSATSRTAYIDGGSPGSNTTNTTPASLTSTAVGRLNRQSPTTYFSGSIDDVRIYNRALSAAEVAALYRMGR